MIRRLAAAPAVLAVLGSLLIAAPSTAAGDPDYHRPTVGECRDLSWDDIMGYSDPGATTDCSETHSARTIAVVSVPDDLERSDQERAVKIAMQKCGPATEGVLGRTSLVRARSAYGYAWFMPTASEWRHGARWIRCDLVLFGGKHLMALPTDDQPALPQGALPDQVARCLVGRNLYPTVCSRTHQWRAVSAFTLRQKAYPDDNASQRRISRRCDALTSTRTYRWTYAGTWAWKHGHHEVVCYDKTAR